MKFLYRTLILWNHFFVTLAQFPLGWPVFSPDYILRLQFNDFRCRFEFGYLEKGDNIDLQRYISSFVFPNLKKVKIVISPGMCLEDHLEWEYIRKVFQLSKFLLKNALVLEKFVIVSSRRRCEICYTKCVSRYLSRLAKKLLNCPRSSANSVIIFQEWAFCDLTASISVSGYKNVPLY